MEQFLAEGSTCGMTIYLKGRREDLYFLLFSFGFTYHLIGRAIPSRKCSIVRHLLCLNAKLQSNMYINDWILFDGSDIPKKIEQLFMTNLRIKARHH